MSKRNIDPSPEEILRRAQERFAKANAFEQEEAERRAILKPSLGNILRRFFSSDYRRKYEVAVAQQAYLRRTGRQEMKP